MTFALHSHPEHEAPRLAGVEHLREWLAMMRDAPDRVKEPDLPCPHCGAALNIRASRHRVSLTVYHPGATCQFSERFWHYATETRETAVNQWNEENSA